MLKNCQKSCHVCGKFVFIHVLRSQDIYFQNFFLVFSLSSSFFRINYKNYNFFDCDWFKKLLFSTNSLVKLLSNSFLLDSLLSGQFNKTNHVQSCSLNQTIITSALIILCQSFIMQFSLSVIFLFSRKL